MSAVCHVAMSRNVRLGDNQCERIAPPVRVHPHRGTFEQREQEIAGA